MFKEAFELIKNKEHLSLAGLNKLVAIRSFINKGLLDELKIAFPDLDKIDRPLVQNPVIPDPQWVAGFTSGEGSFAVYVYKSKTKLG